MLEIVKNDEVLKKAIELGIVTDVYLNKHVYIVIKDKYYGNEWTLRGDSNLLKTLKEYEEYFPKYWSDSYESFISKEDFFAKYSTLKLPNGHVIRETIKLGIVKYHHSDEKNAYVEIKDSVYGDKWIVSTKNIANYDMDKFLNWTPPLRWDDSYSEFISREEYFWKWQVPKDLKGLLLEAKSLGLVREKFLPKKLGVEIKDCCLGNWFFVSFRELVKFVNKNGRDIGAFYKYKPRQYKEVYGLSREEFYFSYGISDKLNKEVLLEARKLGLLKYDYSTKHNTYLKIKYNDSDGWFSLQEHHIPKNVTIDYFLNFSVKANDRSFIEDYEKSKTVLDTSEIQILDSPIVLNEQNIGLIKGKAVVWELCDIDSQKSIYVGEHKNGNEEIDALLLYIRRDYLGTKNRRSKAYGYGSNQPLIDKIWGYNFCVRLLATGKQGDSKQVRAYESIWNTESNDGSGCIIKQGGNNE